MNPIPQIPMPASTGHPGSDAFQAIVTLLRNRTGLGYQEAFHQVQTDNADLFRQKLDATEHTRPLHLLLNRIELATGLGPVASTELAVKKISQLTNEFFPQLSAVPTAFQWDVLCRTALQLEKCGVTHQLINRLGDASVSASEWSAANKRAAEVFTFLEDRATKPRDFGTTEVFQSMSPDEKLLNLVSFTKQIMRDQGISRRDAFEHLKETQPLFWMQAVLSYQPNR